MTSILPELWLLIFPYLSHQDLCSVTLTCSSFRYLAQPLLFSTLDVSPFLLAYSTDTPIRRPKSYLERSLKRVNIYQSPHLIFGVRDCWISPYSRSGFPQRNQHDDLDPNLLINAIVRVLPSFPNLTSLAWHCIDFEPEWWDILQSLPIKALWLNSSSIPSPLRPPLSPITHLHIDQWPWEGKPTNYVSMHEESMDGVPTETLQTIIHPLTTESLSIPRIETASRVFRILSQKTHSIRSLNIPLPAILDDHFTAAITSCPQLESISICPQSSDDPRQNFDLDPFRPDALPMLTSYDGPYTHVMQFSHRPLKQIKLWGFAQRPTFCDSSSVTEKLRSLANTAVVESLVSIQVTVYDTTAQFLQVFASFKQLELLTIQSQDNYSKKIDAQETHPIMILYQTMSNITLPQTLKFLTFSTRITSSKQKLSKQGRDAACFTECLARRHPCLQRLEINYGVYWTGTYSVIWGRIRENTDAEVTPAIDELSTLPKDVAESYSSKSSSKDFIISTVVSSVHPLPLGKLTFTETRRKIMFQNLKISSTGNVTPDERRVGIWAMTWRKIRRLLQRH